MCISNQLKKLSILLSCSIIGLSYGGECSTRERDKAEYFAEKAGEKIISKYSGGQDKRTKVTSCEYNSYSEVFKLNIEVYWNGLFNRDNNYNVDGVLKLKKDGTPINFSQTYANQNAKDWGFFIKVIEFADAAAEAQSKRGYRLHFTNECDEKLDLAIHYMDVSGNWKTKGWWSFAPNEGAYLNSGDNALRTKNSIIYYYVESPNNSYLKTDGSHKFKLSGRTLYMKKIEDKSGDTRWSVSCN